MQSKRTTNANQPALIPIAGNFDRKPRYLDREVTTIGRARGTDLCFEANEISTLHCVIYRTAEGYRIRDCNSRCGVRINGDAVKGSSILRDADIVNLGPFSFEFRLPPAIFPEDGKRLDPVKVQHLKDSRRRLAELALKMRKRVNGAGAHDQEWQQKGHLLKEKIRCYDQRSRELEAAEEELDEERNQLGKEAEKHRQHVQTIEQQLAERLAEADKEIHARWQAFQQRCQAEETRRPVDSSADSWAVNKQQLQREQQEFANMKEQWVQDQTKAATDLEAQHAALAQKRTDLLRMMGDLKKMQEDLRKQAKPEVRELQDEIDRLQRENTELRSQPQDDGAVEDLRSALAIVRAELEDKEKILNDLIDHAGSGAEQDLRAENELLKQLLAEKDRVVEELNQQPKAPKSSNDLERYETELNDFRRQLEDDRNKLNKEVETLRERNKELDEAIREMEMEMSKERAELARERMRLERVREEVKADAERLVREVAVRDSMAPVQKLRDELNSKQPAKADKPGMRTTTGS